MTSRTIEAPQGGGTGRKSPFLASVGGLVTALDWSGRIIAAFCLSFMFVALLVNVILRYALGEGIAWAYEIHALLLPWLVAAGIVIASSRRRHIAITLLPTLLNPQTLRVLEIAIRVAILVIAISVLWSSQPILKAAQFQSLSTLGIKQVWGYASLVFAFGGMAIIATVDLLRLLGGVHLITHDPAQASIS